MTRLVIGKASLAIACGIFAGLGAFTFGYGDGASYLSDDPASCANCHVMQEHLNSWERSSHASVASCNACHLSHHPIGKWITKADNGFFHSLAFTTGNFPEKIQIKPRNRRVTQAACMSCHESLLHPVQLGDPAMASCVHCHRDVGHALR